MSNNSKEDAKEPAVAAGFKRMQIVECDSDSSDEEEPKEEKMSPKALMAKLEKAKAILAAQTAEKEKVEENNLTSK